MAHWNGLYLWEVLTGVIILLLLDEMTALMLPLFLLLYTFGFIAETASRFSSREIQVTEMF